MIGGDKSALRRKGISSISAAVILLAVSIVVAVSVAYWTGSLSTLYTRYEKLEIVSSYAIFDYAGYKGVDPGWNVTVNLKNTGTQDTTIELALVNGKPMDEYVGSVDFSTSLPLHIETGHTASISFQIKQGDGFSNGVFLDFSVHSTQGHEYSVPIMLG